MTLFYPTPTQLKYWNSSSNIYCCGIGFRTNIIDICNGEVFSTKEIIEGSPFEDDAILEYGDWKDLTPNFEKK